MIEVPLLVFADDWGRHPSSCQHLIRHLLDRHTVHWVNTIGTRPPRWNLDTLRRGWEKIRHWTRRSDLEETLPDRLKVYNPRMWPWFRSQWDRRINRRLLGRSLAALIETLPAPPIAITTLPIVADLVGLLPVRCWIYYCVDDFSEWPGLDGATLRRLEETLVRRADTLIAVSETLRERLAGMGRTAHLLTHGVDLDFWSRPQDAVMIPQLAEVERPLVVFWGVVDRRMDVEFVRRLGAELTRGTIVLAGPASDPDPALAACRRVLRLGPLPFTQLPILAREAAVLVMPYADLPVTRAMQPLKLKEYLATGKPVVVRDLPATREWADCLDLADTAEAFVRTVRLRLETGLPQEQEVARARLSEESWEEKARRIEQWILPAHSATAAI
jgi:glycosyltransferase involved in cell wall biosynthesis